ncbi:MAG TPA: hypothetical protein VF491_12795, partial [Vicinamibacterales bacterium]
MDLGIPELPAGRDAASDATRRRGKADSSDFATLLDRAVDDQDQQPRDPATEKTAPAAGSDKPRDKVRSVEHADDSDDQGEDKNAVTANATPAQEPVKQAQPDTKTETVEKSPTPAQSPEHKNANEAPASAPSEQLAEEAAAATAPPQSATTPSQAGTDAKAAQTTPAPAAAQPPSEPADDAVANENA